MTVATRERPVRAVVIDDTTDIRDLLRFALSRGGMDVVGEAGDGQAGVEVVREERPDVVLLDLAMPVMDGVEALPLIRELVPDAQIIVFSAFARRGERPGPRARARTATCSRARRCARSSPTSTARSTAPSLRRDRPRTMEG